MLPNYFLNYIWSQVSFKMQTIVNFLRNIWSVRGCDFLSFWASEFLSLRVCYQIVLLSHLFDLPNFLKNGSQNWRFLTLNVRQSQNDFFKLCDVSSKKRKNKFYFTTMSLVFITVNSLPALLSSCNYGFLMT
jgi:hypothetical protein